jgi:hypothetical protein
VFVSFEVSVAEAAGTNLLRYVPSGSVAVGLMLNDERSPGRFIILLGLGLFDSDVEG